MKDFGHVGPRTYRAWALLGPGPTSPGLRLRPLCRPGPGPYRAQQGPGQGRRLYRLRARPDRAQQDPGQGPRPDRPSSRADRDQQDSGQGPGPYRPRPGALSPQVLGFLFVRYAALRAHAPLV